MISYLKNMINMCICSVCLSSHLWLLDELEELQKEEDCVIIWERRIYWCIMKQMWCIPFSKRFLHIFHPFRTQQVSFVCLSNLFICFPRNLRKLMWGFVLILKRWPFLCHDLMQEHLWHFGLTWRNFIRKCV